MDKDTFISFKCLSCLDDLEAIILFLDNDTLCELHKSLKSLVDTFDSKKLVLYGDV